MRSGERSIARLRKPFSFPEELWVSLYTTNPVERVIQELKRRFRPVVLLPNQEAAEKLAYLVCLNLNEKFSRRRLRRWAGELTQKS